MVVPSSFECSALSPARPSAKTTNDRALSNHRFALLPCSSRSQAWWASAGTTSSRQTANSAVSTTSRAARLSGAASSSACRVVAQSSRASVVRCPTEVPGGASVAVCASTARRPASSSSSVRGTPPGPRTSRLDACPRENTRTCRRTTDPAPRRCTASAGCPARAPGCGWPRTGTGSAPSTAGAPAAPPPGGAPSPAAPCSAGPPRRAPRHAPPGPARRPRTGRRSWRSARSGRAVRGSAAARSPRASCRRRTGVVLLQRRLQLVGRAVGCEEGRHGLLGDRGLLGGEQRRAPVEEAPGARLEGRQRHSREQRLVREGARRARGPSRAGGDLRCSTLTH